MGMKAAVEEYKKYRRTRIREQLRWFADQPSLALAIEKAALSVDRCDHRMPHQRRIKHAVLQSAKRKLLGVSAKLQRCADFDELFATVEQTLDGAKGVGPLYLYDVSLRIGGKLGLAPTKVYLHAGAKVGARRLLRISTKSRTIEKSAIPAELRHLAAAEVEDFLCIYKDGYRSQKTTICDGEPSGVC